MNPQTKNGPEMDIFSFLAIWFNNLRNNVFKVEVINKDNQVALQGKLSEVVSTLKGLSKDVQKVEVLNQKDLNLKGLEDKISSVVSLLKTVEYPKNDKLEGLIQKLIDVSNSVKEVKVINNQVPQIKFPEINIPEIKFPRVQEVQGQVNITNVDTITKGLQVVVDAINDLKTDMSHEMRGMSTTVIGGAGSRISHKITDGSKDATITTVGDDNGLDVNIIGGSLSATVDTTGLATEAKQDDIITTLQGLSVSVDTTGLATDSNQTNGSQKTQIVDAGGEAVTVTGGKLDVNASVDTTGLATSAKQDTIIGHVDGIETLIGTTNSSLSTIAGAVSGTEMQVDVLTMPTTTVQATNLDIRDLTSASDSVEVKQATGTNLHAVIDSGTITTITNAVTVSSHNVTNAGTFAVQVDGSALTSLQLIDDSVSTIASATPAKGISVSGTDGTNARVLKTDTSGELQIDVLTIAAGNNNIGDVDIASIAAGDNNIGNVDIVTVPTDPFGANADAASATGSISAKLRFIAATGIPITSIAAGTNAIGKLAANSGVDIGDVDVTSLPALTAGTNAIGKLLPPDIDVTTHTNYARKYYTNAGAVTDGIVWSPAAGKRWHVVTMYIQVSAAATVTLEDDKAGGDDPVWKGELAANSGVVLSFTEKYPMASGEDAADLLITTSAGNVYVTCVGYEI